MLTCSVAPCAKRMDAPGIQSAGRFESVGRFESAGLGSDWSGDPMLSVVGLLSLCSSRLVNIHQFDDEVQV